MPGQEHWSDLQKSNHPDPRTFANVSGFLSLTRPSARTYKGSVFLRNDSPTCIDPEKFSGFTPAEQPNLEEDGMTTRPTVVFAVLRAVVNRSPAAIWRHVARCCALALLLVVALPAAGYAQGASITGIARDTSGAVLPGVTIEAASPILIEKVRTTVSGSDGQYRIVNLLPGAYTVTATLAGFSTYKREGLELTGDFTATVNIELRVGAQEETVTVTGEAPIIDVQGIQRQHVMTDDLVQSLPTGKYIVNLGVLIPGVSASCAAACQAGTAQDTGGSSGDSMSTLLVHGSRYRDTRISFNNFVVTSNAGITGTTGPNVEAMLETQIDTSGGDAQGQAGGVRINFVPKDGGNTFSGGLFLSGTNENFQSENLDQDLEDRGLLLTAAGHVKNVYDIAPTVGGPIMKDKLWFFLSVSLQQRRKLRRQRVSERIQERSEDLVVRTGSDQAGRDARSAADGRHSPDVAGDAAEQVRRLLRLPRPLPVHEPGQWRQLRDVAQTPRSTSASGRSTTSSGRGPRR